MSLNEFQMITQYFQSAFTTDDVLLGIGDDAAIIQPLPGHRMLVSADTLVESVHFPRDAPPDLVARRALRVNLSDMAAMAAQPRWFTLALTLPETNSDWLESFSKGLLEDAEAFGCCLVGGDTTRGPLNIGIQIMGTVAEDKPALTRSGAQSGDLLLVTGNLGGAAGALEYLDQSGTDQGVDQDVLQLCDRYWLPEPRIVFAQKAAHLINAACDISDGLLADVGHICTASGLGVQVQADRLPLSGALKNVCGSDATRLAMTGGDDYELCMAVAPENLSAIEQIATELEVPVTEVGVFKKGETGVSCLDKNGEIIEFESAGYSHF